jgi:hypothetical protein
MTQDLWIPISKGTPNNGRSVLVLTNFHQMMVASYHKSDGAFQYDHEDQVTTDRITHWRELPEYP